MKPSDALAITRTIEHRWRVSMTDRQREQFANDLADLDAGRAAAALDVLHREGSGFVPTAGAIRRRLAELELAPPDWAEVKRSLIERSVAVRDYEPPEWACPFGECDGSGWLDVTTPDSYGPEARKCRCYEQRVAGRRLAETLHPLVREFIEQRYVSWAEVERVGEAAGTRDVVSLEAQMREKWAAFAARAVQSRAVASLSLSSELRGLERARSEDDRRGDLRRVDGSRLLPSVT